VLTVDGGFRLDFDNQIGRSATSLSPFSSEPRPACQRFQNYRLFAESINPDPLRSPQIACRI
jgi:hypothetical protein